MKYRKEGIIQANTMEIEAGFDLIISVKDVFEFERKLLDGIVFENFPEKSADRVLAYMMGVHDFAKMLADEFNSGNGLNWRIRKMVKRREKNHD